MNIRKNKGRFENFRIKDDSSNRIGAKCICPNESVSYKAIRFSDSVKKKTGIWD